ncbi:MAG: hypothetical protein WBA25_06370 [Jannaschia sp.]
MQDSPRLEIVCLSDSDDMLREAEAVAEGVRRAGVARTWRIAEDSGFTVGMWHALDAADCIVLCGFACADGLTLQAKTFADASHTRMFGRVWEDKLAGAFTDYGCPAGEETEVMQYLWTLIHQHGMVWAAQGQIATARLDADPRYADLTAAQNYGRKLAELASIFAAERRESEQLAA